MKRILLLAMLAGFTAAGSYAQDTKSCCCAKKPVVHHKVAVTHKTTPVNRSANGTNNLAVMAKESSWRPACYSYTQHNIQVTECPGIMYDDKGNIEYRTEGTYMGNYPRNGYYNYYPLDIPAVTPPVDTSMMKIQETSQPPVKYGPVHAYDNDCKPDCSAR